MTMILNVRAGHLSAALQNALTFADDFLLNFILLIVDNTRMSVISTDGYVSISDTVDIENPNGDEYGWFCLPRVAAEEFFGYAKGLKDLKTKPGWVTLSFDPDRLRTRDNIDGAEHSYPLVRTAPDNRYIATLRRLFEFEGYFEKVSNSPVAIHPERLRDIARVKLHCHQDLKGLLSMDMMAAKNPLGPKGVRQDLLCIKYGPDVRIVLAGINRKTMVNTLSKIGTSTIEEGREVVRKCTWEEISAEDLHPS